jgi:L-aspartate oxidase
MPRYDVRGELAPRDIVSRAIANELTEKNIEHVYLDISHKPAALIAKRFPNILKVCAEHGIDMKKEPIPVVPAAHYTCGGIVTDQHGQTEIQSLYALGECSSTGLHGANRLASNSLLEALAFEKTVSGRITEQASRPQPPLPHLLSDRECGKSERRSSLDGKVASLRRLMWQDVGIVRSRESLTRAERSLRAIERQLEREWSDGRLRSDVLEFRNLLTVAQLITTSALQRQESRGLHFNSDYPSAQTVARDTALRSD